LRASTVQTRCPVRALRTLRALATSANGFVFPGPGGGGLTRQAVDKRLRALARAAEAETADTPTPRPAAKAVRDAALLACGWFAALRRSNLSALTWRDLLWHESGEIRVHLRRSKTDQVGEGAYNWLPQLPDDVACPVTALTRWRDRLAELVGGDPRLVCPDAPVFPAMNRHDQLKRDANTGIRRLLGAGINEVVQEIAVAAGVVEAPPTGARFAVGGHSLRAGLVTQACMAGIPLLEIAKVTHHRDPRSLSGYHRPTDRSQIGTIRAVVGLAA
jgi:integrase